MFLKMSNNVKRKYWLFEVYEDSCPKNWQDIAEQIALPMAFSPLHDKDTYTSDVLNENNEVISRKGDFKKAHRHVILAYSNTTTYNTALEVAKKFGANIVKPCDSIKGSYEYHIHKNNPQKFQYNDEDRILLNGFNINDYITLSEEDEVSFHKQIYHLIYDNHIISLTQLCSLLLNSEESKYFSLVMKNSYFYSKIIEECKNMYLSTSKRSDTPLGQ